MSPNDRGVVTVESGIPHYSPAPPLLRGPAATVRGIRLTKSKAGAATPMVDTAAFAGWRNQYRQPAPRQGPAGPLAERAELAATAPAFGKCCSPMPSTPFPEAIRGLESRSARLDARPRASLRTLGISLA